MQIINTLSKARERFSRRLAGVEVGAVGDAGRGPGISCGLAVEVQDDRRAGCKAAQAGGTRWGRDARAPGGDSFWAVRGVEAALSRFVFLRRSSVESRTGALTVGSGGYSVAFASGLSPAPLSRFQSPLSEPDVQFSRISALQWDHASRTRVPGRIRGRLLWDWHPSPTPSTSASGLPPGLLTP